MQRTAIVLGLLAAVAMPVIAEAKTKKAKPAKTEEPISQNEASWRLAKGAVPLFLPSYVLPIYLKMNGDLDPPADKTQAKKK